MNIGNIRNNRLKCTHLHFRTFKTGPPVIYYRFRSLDTSQGKYYFMVEKYFYIIVSAYKKCVISHNVTLYIIAYYAMFRYNLWRNSIDVRQKYRYFNEYDFLISIH